MKKIKSLKQLRREKRLLRQREKELLFKINVGWEQLKENLQPQNILKPGIQCKERRPNTNDEKILKSLLSFGATLLARKLAKGAGEKFGGFLVSKIG
ncbi:MAG TPA: hypothetical protein VFP97_00660 [Chitinophagaceae bacterium]|nr:hypothetical protein [Chitinophagaceae bacterium]